MMQFTDMGGFNAYNTALDNLANSWDALNGQSIPAGDQFVLSDNPGNPAFNAVDYALLFNSTRYDYAYMREVSGTGSLVLQGEPEVRDNYLQRVMNLDEEVYIGGYIYKQLYDGIIAKIPANDYTALSLVRLYGATAPVLNMELLDEDNGGLVSRSPVQLRGACNVQVTAKQVANSTNVIAKGSVFNGGNACGGSIIYNFGDGTGDFRTNGGSFTHFYNVPFGTSKAFTIKITIDVATGTGCSDCNGNTATTEVTVTNFGSCHDGENPEKPHTIEFQGRTGGGTTVDAHIITKFGFRGKSALFARPKIWLNVCLEIFTRGKWRSANPSGGVTMSTSRFLKTNNCADNSSADFSKSTNSSSDELVVTSNSGHVPTQFGIIESDRNNSLWGKVTFGPLTYEKPFWEW